MFSERSAQVNAKLDRADRSVAPGARRRGPRPAHDRRAGTPSGRGVPPGQDPRDRRGDTPRRVGRPGPSGRLRPERPHRRPPRQSVDTTGTSPSDEALIAEALRRAQAESAAWLRADVARHLVEPRARRRWSVSRATSSPRSTASPTCADRTLYRRSAPTRTDRPDETAAPSASPSPTACSPPAQVLDQEIRLQSWAEASTRPSDRRLDPQSAAVEAITGHAPLVVVVGPAGTGKTTTTAQAVQALRGPAAAGRRARTIGQGRRRPRHRSRLSRPTPSPDSSPDTAPDTSRWPAGTTVILDEAGMTATDDLARLVDLVRQHRWRLVAVGDPAQLPAVGRGGVFAHWCNTIPHIELATPRRFRPTLGSRSQPRSCAPATRPPSSCTPSNGRLRTAHPALLAHRRRSISPTPYRRRPHRRHHHQHRRDRSSDQPRHPTLHQHPPSSPSVQLADGTDRPGRRPDRHPPQRPDLAHRPRRAGPEPPHLDRHRRRRRRSAHRRPPRAGRPSSSPPTTCRPRRARLGRHRLRQPRRHRRRRPSPSSNPAPPAATPTSP